MIKTAPTEPDSIVETPEERRKRFLLEFERPFKCEKCNERFKKKKYLREHKSEDPFLLNSFYKDVSSYREGVE